MQLYPDKMLTLLEWRRDLRNIMGRISADYSVREEAACYDRYFSRREDVCLGVNEGWYAGAEAVKGYYEALGREIALVSKLVQKDFPEKLGDKSDAEIYGVGAMTYLPFDSQIIEIADDQQTAKGLWNIRGSYSRMTVSGPVAYWWFGWAAVDFIYEEGQWKIWHLQLLKNLDCQCGTAFGAEPQQFEPVAAYAELADFHMPEPNIPTPVLANYYPGRPHVTSPAMPVPYETFADTFSYGI